MAVNPKQKFSAAVKVIRSLPKNGSFQPSHDMMLKFYGFYKQSTEGPCREVKPSFWDAVKKAKWEAWHKLGEMPEDEAMIRYVDELKMIIETMPQTQDVADFMETLGTFYELVEDKIPVGDGVSVVSTKSSSPEKDANGDLSDLPDANHSAMVDEMLKQSEVGGGDVSLSDIIGSKPLDHNKNVDHDNTDETEEDETDRPVPTNGIEEKHKPSNHIGSETESESEEFCDTSDEPIMEYSGQVSSSTPLTKAANHVRFSETNVVHTEVEVHAGRVSPIESDPAAEVLDVVNIPGMFPFGQSRPLSESLVANAPSMDGFMSISGGSGLNISRSQLEPAFSRESIVSVDLSQPRCEAVQVRGGGEQQQSRQGGHPSSDRCEASTSRGRQGPGSGSGSGSRRGLFSGSGGAGGGRQGDEHHTDPGEVSDQIAVAMVRLQQDMNSVLSRLGSLESVSRNKAQEELRRRKSLWRPRWWPFRDISMTTAAFVLLWPFFAHLLITLLKRRRRQ